MIKKEKEKIDEDLELLKFDNQIINKNYNNIHNKFVDISDQLDMKSIECNDLLYKHNLLRGEYNELNKKLHSKIYTRMKSTSAR